MHFSKVLATLVVLPAAVLSLPAPLDNVAPSLYPREFTTPVNTDNIIAGKRDNCAVTCGNTCYYQSDIDDAISTGYGDYQDGNAPGNYPHTYNNYEGFNFGVSGPYQEFPILSSYKAYTGGSPGPDRVIFNTNGQQAGVVTHTGASGNNFVACDGGV